MIKNYLKTAWRTISKNKIYSGINIIGLTIGICASMMVGTIIVDDLSYDRQWKNSENMYRVLTVNKMGDGVYDKFPSAFVGLFSVLKNDFPEAKEATSISSTSLRLKVDDNDPNGVKLNILQADTTVWNMLNINVLQGNPQKYVAGKRNLVITETMRKKYFANENPVGKIINDVPDYSEKPKSYYITGVVKDLPSNSVFRSEAFVVSRPWDEALSENGSGTFTEGYVLFIPGTDVAKFTQKLNHWYAGFVKSKTPFQYEFQPLRDVYLHSDFAPGQEVKGDFKNILILGGVALLLLIIACVNFVNLSTARAIYRLKESGIRKILGAGRRQLIGQFLTESFLFFLTGFILAGFVYAFAFHPVENFLGHPLAKNFVTMPSLLTLALSVVIILSIFTGWYPAWILSGFNPAATLKGKLFAGNRTTQYFVRRGLVVAQFAISIFVLIALIVVQHQVSFMKHKDPGYNKDNLMNISFINWNGKGQTFKNELKNIPGVVNASISSWAPGVGAGYMSRQIDDPDRPNERVKIWYINGDADFAQTLGLQLIRGRFLDGHLSSDAVPPDSAMENMTTRSGLFTNYTAKFLYADLNKFMKSVSIIPVGVVGDFNTQSLKTAIEPTIITAQDSMTYGSMLVRVQPGMQQKVAGGVHTLFRSFFPEKLLEIKWVEDIVAEQYKAESKLQKIFLFFSSLTMLLAALGIFGLIVQATVQRTKEIGIRKVLGASVISILKIFSIDFVKLILIALVIASPVAWWLMHRWLEDYAYRITIGWWVFVVAGLIALLIALLTISFQAVRAARANPVKALRSE